MFSNTLKLNTFAESIQEGPRVARSPPPPSKSSPLLDPQDPSKISQSRPQIAQETPSSRLDGQDRCKIALRGPPDRFPTPQDRPQKAQERPKSPQERPKTIPRGLKSESRALKSDSGEARISKIVVFPKVFQFQINGLTTSLVF
mgnify:CR=1 FL=1